MTVTDFVTKYNVGQLGNINNITLNIQTIGEMLKSHTIDELPEIIEEMCNISVGNICKSCGAELESKDTFSSIGECNACFFQLYK